MKRTVLALGLLVLFATSGFAQSKYASAETETIIDKMIEAHGGYDKWKNLETLSFQNIMFSAGLPGSPFWISRITLDMKGRKVYQDWPLHEDSMAYNGEEAWGVNWRLGNPPKFEALFFYYFVNLPWLTKDDNVRLGEVEKIDHPTLQKPVYRVEMTFTEKPAVGKTAADKFVLFIAADNYQLAAYEYTMGYGHMLDLMGIPEGQLLGPMFRVNQYYKNVGGLLFPVLFKTGNTDLSQTYGNHAITDYALNGTFDQKRMQKPANAVVDTSSEFRKAK